MSNKAASSLIDVFVVLLEQGCDPTLDNFDAALSPIAWWTLLCSALEKAEENIRDVVLAVDDNSSNVLSDAEIEEKFADVLKRIIRTGPWQPGKRVYKIAD